MTATQSTIDAIFSGGGSARQRRFRMHGDAGRNGRAQAQASRGKHREHRQGAGQSRARGKPARTRSRSPGRGAGGGLVRSSRRLRMVRRQSPGRTCRRAPPGGSRSDPVVKGSLQGAGLPPGATRMARQRQMPKRHGAATPTASGTFSPRHPQPHGVRHRRHLLLRAVNAWRPTSIERRGRGSHKGLRLPISETRTENGSFGVPCPCNSRSNLIPDARRLQKTMTVVRLGRCWPSFPLSGEVSFSSSASRSVNCRP